MTSDTLVEIIDNVSYHDWSFAIGKLGSGFYVQCRFIAPDSCGKDERNWSGRKWYISTHATKDEVVQTCLKAVLTSLEHEARESFKYKGVAIFQPHTPIDELVEIAGRKVQRV